jgi:hypothetical protein
MSSPLLDPAPCPRRSVPPDPVVVRQWVDKTCADQGITVAISDARTIGRLVALLAGATSASATAIVP